jgi:hypothetical protein
LYDKALKQKDLSGVLLITAGAIWVSNIVWVAIKPNNYRPMHHPGFSFTSVAFNQERIAMFSIKVDF